ncbi:MAG: hypothetical protein COA97_04070 [Flavobacteriales bacterium]|nr:MAG: hypothetical protein COA97_04070 [Flavobacteriales bacterium]
MKINKTVLILLMAIVLISCEKDIDIDLPESERKFVVEGSIEPGLPPFVILTKSEGYFSPVDINSLQNAFVHNATVFVSNGTNNIQLTEICTNQLPDSLLPTIAELIGVSLDNLKSFGFCLYTSLDPLIFGEVGKTYSLSIQAEDKYLTSTTTIPIPVPMTRYWYKDQPGYTDYGYLWFELNDPPTYGTAYRIYTQRKGIDSRFIPADGSVFDDHFFNGLQFEAFIWRGHESNPSGQSDFEIDHYFQQGDTIIIKFCTIDQPHFQFWNSFEIATFNNGNPFSAPATIKTNIEGGLGVWGGYGVTYDTLVAVD